MEKNTQKIQTPIQKRNRNKSIATIFFAMLSFLVIFALAALLLHYLKENGELRRKYGGDTAETISDTQVRYTQEEVQQLLLQREQEVSKEVSEETRQAFRDELKDLMLSGNGALNAVRYFFPDQIVLVDSGNYLFYDIDDTLAKHPYANENLVFDDNNELFYCENDQPVSHKGIDVSSFQGEIDWRKVAEDGVEFALIRVGLRGYGEAGRLVLDTQFTNNIQGATAAGIDVGVYFFTQATTVQEAEEEADFVLEALAPYGLHCTVALDVEDVGVADARTVGLTKEQWTDHCLAFLNKIEAAGYRPMIYGNLKAFILMLDITRIEPYPKWFAAYTPYIYFPYDFKVWQYTDSGQVAGIKKKVDMNISFYDFSLQ